MSKPLPLRLVPAIPHKLSIKKVKLPIDGISLPLAPSKSTGGELKIAAPATTTDAGTFLEMPSMDAPPVERNTTRSAGTEVPKSLIAPLAGLETKEDEQLSLEPGRQDADGANSIIAQANALGVNIDGAQDFSLHHTEDDGSAEKRTYFEADGRPPSQASLSRLSGSVPSDPLVDQDIFEQTTALSKQLQSSSEQGPASLLRSSHYTDKNVNNFGLDDVRRQSASSTSVGSIQPRTPFYTSNTSPPFYPPGLHLTPPPSGHTNSRAGHTSSMHPPTKSSTGPIFVADLHGHGIQDHPDFLQQGNVPTNHRQLSQASGDHAILGGAARVHMNRKPQNHANHVIGFDGCDHDLPRPRRLLDHLQLAWDNPSLSDCTVKLLPPSPAIEALTISLHAIVLAQSARLGSILTRHDQDWSIHLISRTGALIDLEAFIMALRYLYGQPLLHQQWNDRRFFKYIHDDELTSTPRFRTSFALAYVAAGHFLQIEEIVHCGLDLALQNLSWTSLVRMISFVVFDEANTTWRHESDRSPRGPQGGMLEEMDGPLHPLAGRMLSAVADFMISNWPEDFSFVPDAAEFELLGQSRSPHISHDHTASVSSSSDSRLTAIRFGDMSASSTSGARDRASQASASQNVDVRVALSQALALLPTPLLQHVLEHPLVRARMPAHVLLETGRAAVQERERRRGEAQAAVMAANPHAAPGAGSLGVESVEVQRDGGERFTIVNGESTDRNVQGLPRGRAHTGLPVGG